MSAVAPSHHYQYRRFLLKTRCQMYIRSAEWINRRTLFDRFMLICSILCIFCNVLCGTSENALCSLRRTYDSRCSPSIVLSMPMVTILRNFSIAVSYFVFLLLVLTFPRFMIKQIALQFIQIQNSDLTCLSTVFQIYLQIIIHYFQNKSC